MIVVPMAAAKKKRTPSLKPRNPVVRSPLLGKGGAHAKTQQALRKQAKDALRKQILKEEEES